MEKKEGDYDGNDNSNSGGTRDDVYRSLILQRVNIVLTAHLTEVNRKNLLAKLRRIS